MRDIAEHIPHDGAFCAEEELDGAFEVAECLKVALAFGDDQRGAFEFFQKLRFRAGEGDSRRGVSRIADGSEVDARGRRVFEGHVVEDRLPPDSYGEFFPVRLHEQPVDDRFAAVVHHVEDGLGLVHAAP